ncbi:hypothetical protein VP01_1774g2 [Puccinia sorghi]|uniref:Uncharacterized protein n=1 Tax=Puccinia sorghi TaxID=27349 RepID=A0A0L6VFB3_9BASI|nr:hypothetical protein VP01_1774g2 [Puccinia sorghi]
MARNLLIEIFWKIQETTHKDFDEKAIPKEIPTMMKHLNVSPVLNSHVCCPTCFFLYEGPDIPTSCSSSSQMQDFTF